jgi:nicotinate-nucleotide adenylyltransferase
MTHEKKPRRLGILGGSFDPVHNGHLGLAKSILTMLSLDSVLFVPVCISPHKLEQTLADPQHRLAMLQLATRSEPAFAVTDLEIRTGGISYTVDTLERLHTLHPESELFLILGWDAFREFNAWKNPEKILELCHVVVATRPGYGDGRPEHFPAQPAFANFERCGEGEPADALRFRNRATGRQLAFMQIDPVAVSASDIRQKVLRGAPIKNLLPSSVEHYIIEHRLYSVQPRPGI